MPCSVEILNVDRIAPYPPPPAVTIPLSFFDAFWIALPPIQRLLIFPNPHLPFPSILRSLKSSLSTTLARFPSFAGNLTLLPPDVDSGGVAIEVSAAAPGIAFVEAACDGDVDRLVSEQIHETETFTSLVPQLDGGGVLPMPVMAVQVTEFVDGGTTVGVTIHHTVADGKGVWMFLDAWAKESRGEEVTTLPMHDRAVIGLEAGDVIARRFVKELVPNLPQMPVHALPMESRLRIQRRTFTLSSSTVHSLKQRIIDQSNTSDRPSTFCAVSSYVWSCLAHVTCSKADVTSKPDVTNLAFLADLRHRLDPPIPDAYTGNCVSPCYASSPWTELVGPHGLSRACEKIARAAREWTRDPLKGCESWVKDFQRIPEAGRVILSGSPRFRVYETCFGWGKPGRVELVSLNNDGEAVLVGGKDSGSVQVSVGLDPVRMEAFVEVFEGGII